MTTAEPPIVEAAVERLWAPHLPQGFTPARKLRWFYRETPGGNGTMLLLVHDAPDHRATAEVVGAAGVGPRIVSVHGAPTRAAWLTDLIVEKAHRTALPAIILQRAVRRHCRARYAFSFGFPNAHATGVYARVGYREVGKLTRYARVLRHAEYARRKGWPHRGADVAGWLLDAPSRAGAWASSARSRRGLDIEWVTDADARFDALWERASERHAVVECRVAEHLAWRFFRHPARSFEVAVLADRAAHTIRAYVVVERVAGVAAIWDMFGESDDDVRLLVDRAAMEMRARGAFAMSVYAVGASMNDLLESCGFRAREGEKKLMVDAEDLPAAERATVLDPMSWWVADGGEDA